MIGFRNAFRGIVNVLKSERNFRIQLLLFLLVIIAAILFQVTTNEWLVILIFGAMVLSLEMLNSAIERTCDRISKEHDLEIKWIKDVSAGAVLIAAISSVIGAGIIFIPKIVELIN